MRVPLVDLSWQHRQISDEISVGLTEVMGSASFIRGPKVEEFEESFAEFCGVGNCVGVASGTDAIELSLRALGIGPGDEVIVPANSFIASAFGVMRAGADVRLVDCDPATYLIDVESVERVMNPRVRAVMPVHLFGQTAPVDLLKPVIEGAVLVEDAAQAQGARNKGRTAGSLGTIAATSFYPSKNLGAYGDAGAVLTDDDDLAQRVRNLGNWGSPMKYHHPAVGFNSRLDTIQAVVLMAKLRRLAEWNSLRNAAAQRYHDLLGEEPQVALPTTLIDNSHVWHLYVVRVPHRDRVSQMMLDEGIGVGIHYPTPIHLQGAFSFLGHQPGDFPETERAACEMLSLPIFPGITTTQQEQVAWALRSALAEGRRLRG